MHVFYNLSGSLHNLLNPTLFKFVLCPDFMEIQWKLATCSNQEQKDIQKRMPVEEVDFSPLKQGDAQFVGPRGPQRVFLIPFPSRSTTKISTNANLLENHYRTTADHPDHPKHPDQPGHPDHSDQLGHLYQENFNLADLILELEFLPRA